MSALFEMEGSRRVRVGQGCFHVIERGQGPVVLLVHGAGAGAFSFRSFIGPLSKRARVIAPDLPGQCLSRAEPGFRYRLEEMASALGELLEGLGVAGVDVALGHSAGAAIVLSMHLSGATKARRLVGINPALLPLPGWAGWVFPVLARWGAGSPRAARWVARGARVAPGWVESTLADTGSKLDREGLRRYRALAARVDHIEGTLAMMAGWTLDGLEARLHDLDVPFHIWAGEGDRAVSPARSAQLVQRHPEILEFRRFPGGHLAHEEHPELFLSALEPVLRDTNDGEPPSRGTDCRSTGANPCSEGRAL